MSKIKNISAVAGLLVASSLPRLLVSAVAKDGDQTVITATVNPDVSVRLRLDDNAQGIRPGDMIEVDKDLGEITTVVPGAGKAAAAGTTYRGESTSSTSTSSPARSAGAGSFDRIPSNGF